MTTQPPQMPTPSWSAYPPLPPTARNGFGITALALALTGVVFGLVPFTGFLALILGALAVLFGLLGWARVRRGEATNGGMTVAGTMLGVLVAALGIWGIVITFNAMNKLGNDLQRIGQQSAPAVATDAPGANSDALSGRAFTVIYEVSGGKDGPQINNFTINSNGTAHYQPTVGSPTSSSM
jgi:hypothetical protein